MDFSLHNYLSIKEFSFGVHSMACMSTILQRWIQMLNDRDSKGPTIEINDDVNSKYSLFSRIKMKTKIGNKFLQRLLAHTKLLSLRKLRFRKNRLPSSLYRHLINSLSFIGRILSIRRKSCYFRNVCTTAFGNPF